MWLRWRFDGGVCWGTLLFLAIGVGAFRYFVTEHNYVGLIVAVPFLLGAVAGGWMLWRDKKRRA